MAIEIRPATDLPGAWWVIAQTKSGNAHDFFPTLKQAVDFALSFYGGKVEEVASA